MDNTQGSAAREEEDRAFAGLFLPQSCEDHSYTRIMAEIAALGLERNAWELDHQGYTILMPDQVAAGDLADRLRDKLLHMAERETGARIDPETDESLAAEQAAVARGLYFESPLLEDPVFEEALMNRSALALISYLLGESCILSVMSGILKVRAPETLEFHSDQLGQPAPLPPYAQVANATWVLTDYSPQNGSTVFVPASHKLCRHPTVAEAMETSRGIAVTAPAGSILIWHGNTWHGAVARTTPGLRMSLLQVFNRWYLWQKRPYRQIVPAETLERNPPRFATLMGKRAPYSLADSDGTPVEFTLGQASQFA